MITSKKQEKISSILTNFAIEIGAMSKLMEGHPQAVKFDNSLRKYSKIIQKETAKA